MRFFLAILLCFFSFKSDKEKILDKILSSSHFTIISDYHGCFGGKEDKYEFNNKAKTIEHFVINHFTGKEKKFVFLDGTELLPNDIDTLKKAILNMINNKGKIESTSYTDYKITNGIHSFSFTNRSGFNLFDEWEQSLESREKYLPEIR